MSHVDRIARIRIQLDDWRPAIRRRVEVPLTATLKALHDVIQAAMPFDDDHLFEFRADGKRYAIPDPEWDSLRDKTYSAKTMRLGTLVDRGITQLAYTYDFGDDWRHTIVIEAIADADPAAEYPRYIDGTGRGHPKMSAASRASKCSSTLSPIPSTSSIANSNAGMAVRSTPHMLLMTKSRPG